MIEKTGNDLVVIASQPSELAEGQVAIIEKVSQKELEAQDDLASAETLLAACESAGLNVTHAKRGVVRAKSRLMYLGKVKAALEAGYVIVPNFPGETIAIRVKKDSSPKRDHRERDRWEPDIPAQEGHILPAGEGEYVNPLPEVYRGSYDGKDNAGVPIKRHYAYASGWDDEISLPVDFLKPTVVQRAGMGVSRKIFDEIAVTRDMDMRSLNQTKRVNKGDPMVLGRIYDRRNNKALSFLVAWFVDTKDI